MTGVQTCALPISIFRAEIPGSLWVRGHPDAHSGAGARTPTEEVIRIANGPYYNGAKDYQLFVLNGDNELVRRRVTLGDCNFEYVEVLGGICLGEKVVVSDMREYGTKTILKLK